ncbi:MAG: hypothetical protein QW165_02945, partial [Candidatus Woesearchaeota archaeon]
MRAYRAFFSIVAVIALVFLLFQAVEGRMREGRQCYYVGKCWYDENKVGFRYYQCFGSYAAYSNWIQDTRCIYPDE